MAGRSVLDIAGLVAEVAAVLEAASLFAPAVATRSLDAVSLIHRSERGADVFQFVIDIVGDFGEADDQGQDRDGGDQDQFSGDDETALIVVQGEEKIRHGVWLSF